MGKNYQIHILECNKELSTVTNEFMHFKIPKWTTCVTNYFIKRNYQSSYSPTTPKTLFYCAQVQLKRHNRKRRSISIYLGRYGKPHRRGRNLGSMSRAHSPVGGARPGPSGTGGGHGGPAGGPPGATGPGGLGAFVSPPRLRMYLLSYFRLLYFNGGDCSESACLM